MDKESTVIRGVGNTSTTKTKVRIESSAGMILLDIEVKDDGTDCVIRLGNGQIIQIPNVKTLLSEN